MSDPKDVNGRRETDLRWAAHQDQHDAHNAVHAQEHATEREVTRQLEKSLERAFVAHEDKHKADEVAVQTALKAVKELAALHADSHKREHESHEHRHMDAQTAVNKAEQSVDKRLESIGVQFGAQTKHTDERYEENRRRIEAIEKGDVQTSSKAEGRSLGQGAVIAIIVGAISLVGTILGIIIVLANLATSVVR